MSCEDCNKESETIKRIAYYRWGTANIGLIGCKKHIKEVIECLNKIKR